MNDEQLLRYSRQIMLPQLGFEGQQKLLNSKVLIAGLGGLGCPVALYLASSGVGTLTLVDFDTVELTNLQRQIAHNTQAIGKLKTHSAAETISGLNPEVKINTFDHAPDKSAWRKLTSEADVVIDCCDNFSTRYEINHACHNTSTPLVSGAAIRFEGQVTVFDFRNKELPCYQCLYPQFNTQADSATETCSDNGVLSPLVGVIGSLQASEAIKIISQIGETLTSKLLLIDLLNSEWRTLKYKKDPTCPTCNKS